MYSFLNGTYYLNYSCTVDVNINEFNLNRRDSFRRRYNDFHWSTIWSTQTLLEFISYKLVKINIHKTC